VRRALFLDIDGVLNSTPYLESLGVRGRTLSIQGVDYSLMLETALVGRLNSIVEGWEVEVVLSSSWKWGHTLDEVRGMLESRGFRGELKDSTPDMVGDRSREIRRWLESQYPPVERFVIVDDMPDAGSGIERHFVQTSTHVGLTDEHVRRAREILR
jgi:hypothetical protein